MSYLLDKKLKRKKILYVFTGIIICLILFYFRTGVFNGFSYLSHTIFRPVLVAGGNIGDKFRSINSFFASKNSLYLENQNLKSKLDENQALLANYDSVAAENSSLKEILGRKNNEASFVLSAILSKPNQSPYDTLIVDAGINENLEKGDTVFALGNIPIGRISEIYPDSSKVILFSNSGEKTQAVVSGRNIFTEAVGRGGGNFEMIVPRDLILSKGDQVILPGIFPYVLGEVVTIVSDPRDPFIKALLVSPVNVQELNFVQVEI